MKIFLILLGVVVLLVVAIIGVGYLLPIKHTATVSAELNAPKNRVWDTIFNTDQYPNWRSDIKRVVINAGDRSWTEYDSHDESLTYKAIKIEEGVLLQTHIQDTDKPFGGGWVISLQSENQKTKITIRENGEVYSPIFRFVSKFIIGHTATADRYLTDLKKEVEAE